MRRFSAWTAPLLDGPALTRAQMTELRRDGGSRADAPSIVKKAQIVSTVTYGRAYRLVTLSCFIESF